MFPIAMAITAAAKTFQYGDNAHTRMQGVNENNRMNDLRRRLNANTQRSNDLMRGNLDWMNFSSDSPDAVPQTPDVSMSSPIAQPTYNGLGNRINKWGF